MSEDWETGANQEDQEGGGTPQSQRGGAHLAPKQKSNRGLLIALIAVIVVLVAVLLYFFVLRKAPEPEIEIGENGVPLREVVVNAENAEQMAQDLIDQDPVRPGNYRAKMNSTWHFANGASASYDGYVENVANNTNDVYFDLELADTGEVICASPVIPRGSHYDEITLNQVLPAGTYDCVIVYHLIDENQNTLSTLRMTVTVVVES